MNEPGKAREVIVEAGREKQASFKRATCPFEARISLEDDNERLDLRGGMIFRLVLRCWNRGWFFN
jgi:hypothetical protein